MAIGIRFLKRHIISVISKSFEEGPPENNIIKILHEILKLPFDKCSHENNQIKM
jgi:predicted metallopeptidase